MKYRNDMRRKHLSSMVKQVYNDYKAGVYTPVRASCPVLGGYYTLCVGNVADHQYCLHKV